MTVLERLKMELAHKQYIDDEEYECLLSENDLVSNNTYNKETMQRNLLLTVLDVLNMLTNDIDLYRKLEDGATGFSQDQAYKLLKERISNLKNRIDTIPLPDEEYEDVCMVFNRKGRRIY